MYELLDVKCLSVGHASPLTRVELVKPKPVKYSLSPRRSAPVQSRSATKQGTASAGEGNSDSEERAVRSCGRREPSGEQLIEAGRGQERQRAFKSSEATTPSQPFFLGEGLFCNEAGNCFSR